MRISDIKLPFGPKQHKALVGIDVSPGYVRVVELVPVSDGYALGGFAVEHLPASAFTDGIVVEMDAAMMAIKKALSSARITAQRAAIAVSGSTVIAKNITMPDSLKDYEMDSQIKADAEQHIPFALQEIALDFEILGPSGTEDGMTDVLLVACKKEQVENRLALLEMANLKPVVVDIEMHAIENAIRLMHRNFNKEENEKTIALVSVGYATTTILVMHNNQVLFTRDQNFGIRQLNEEIMRALALSPEDADRARQKNNFGTEEQSAEILGRFMDELSSQIERALQFFFSAVAQHDKISLVLLAGEVGRLGAELVNGMTWRVSLPVEIARPTAGMTLLSKSSGDKANLDMVESELIVACGLAWRAFDPPRVV